MENKSNENKILLYLYLDELEQVLSKTVDEVTVIHDKVKVLEDKIDEDKLKELISNKNKRIDDCIKKIEEIIDNIYNLEDC